jgi:hypothetical protein
MIGQLALALVTGAYSYHEWIFHGSPSPQNRGEEITSSVCNEVRPNSTEPTQTVVKRPFRVVGATDGFLNIRTGPGPDYEPIAKMPEGSTGLVGRCIPVPGGYKPFCEVEWKGVTGWASSCCLAELEQSTSLLGSSLGGWALADKSNCTVPPKTFFLRSDGGTIVWQDGLGNVDIETVIYSDRNEFRTTTLKSIHKSGRDYPLGTSWVYLRNGDGIQVTEGGLRIFRIVRCR